MIDDNLILREYFTSDNTGINLVLNNDPLSLAEAIRIRKKLDDIGIGVRNLVLNKVRNGDIIENITCVFDGYPIRRFVHSHKDLYGADALKTYLRERADELNFSSPLPN